MIINLPFHRQVCLGQILETFSRNMLYIYTKVDVRLIEEVNPVATNASICAHCFVFRFFSSDHNHVYFMQGKAEIDARNNNLQTALHLAIQGQHMQLVQVWRNRKFHSL